MKNYNEFILKFANVNGSGSASSNQMFAKALFKTGVTVSSKNIFPSNIQGLPTWFSIRVSEKGYTGNRDGVDLMVAMNIATFKGDVESMASGGCFLYDSSFPREFDRDDIKVLGVPLTRLVLEQFGEIKQRFFYKNIACCGVLTSILELDKSLFSELIQEQYATKPKLIPSNIAAFEMGYDWAKNNIPEDYLSFAIRAPEVTPPGKRILISGNEAGGLGCVFAGASFCAWYPITPSTSLPEGFMKYCEKFRHEDGEDQNSGAAKYAIVQAEDEISAAGMTMGAGWNGVRAFTATSGPGISLMSEIIGLAYFAEIPMVLFNVQRGGPSTGMPTKTQQSDILLCAYASHGDTVHPMIFPSDPKESFDFAVKSFDFADRYQTPVFVMLDLDLGMNDWVCEAFDMSEHENWDRGKVMTKDMLDEMPDWGRYLDMDGDAVPYRSLPGVHNSKGAYLTRGTSHDEMAGYTEDGYVHARIIDRIHQKFLSMSEALPPPIYYQAGKTSNDVALFYGTTESSMIEASDEMCAQGKVLDLIRLRSFPFQSQLVENLNQYDRIFVVEQNRDGQMASLLNNETNIDKSKIISIRDYYGAPIIASSIVSKISPYFEASNIAVVR